MNSSKTADKKQKVTGILARIRAASLFGTLGAGVGGAYGWGKDTARRAGPKGRALARYGAPLKKYIGPGRGALLGSLAGATALGLPGYLLGRRGDKWIDAKRKSGVVSKFNKKGEKAKAVLIGSLAAAGALGAGGHAWANTVRKRMLKSGITISGLRAASPAVRRSVYAAEPEHLGKAVAGMMAGGLAGGGLGRLLSAVVNRKRPDKL